MQEHWQTWTVGWNRKACGPNLKCCHNWKRLKEQVDERQGIAVFSNLMGNPLQLCPGFCSFFPSHATFLLRTEEVSNNFRSNWLCLSQLFSLTRFLVRSNVPVEINEFKIRNQSCWKVSVAIGNWAWWNPIFEHLLCVYFNPTPRVANIAVAP